MGGAEMKAGSYLLRIALWSMASMLWSKNKSNAKKADIVAVSSSGSGISARLCATCQFWGGPRQARGLNSVEYSRSHPGVCGGGSGGAMKRGGDYCSYWVKWALLDCN